MKNTLQKDERGLAHVALILIAVLVVAAVGFAGWRVMQNGKDTADNSLASAVKAAAAKCDLDDKDLCKFMASWKENKYYTIKSTDTSEGKTTTSTYQSVGKDKFHMSSSGEFAYDMISIGNTTYTKDTTDNKWWKQTLKPEEEKNYSKSDDLTFEEPSKDEPAADQTTYKKIGKEACGKLTCFKYQVIDPSAKDHTDYIWFDDEDYQLRRMTSESPDGKSDMTFSYEKITISEPSPVKEVGPNQVVIPGSNEVMDMPSEAELQDLMLQYGDQ